MRRTQLLGRMNGILIAVLFASFPSISQGVDGYESLSAESKQKILLTQIRDHGWQTLPPLSDAGWSSILASLKSAMTLGQTFSREGDEFASEKTKLFHTYGVTAAFRMDPLSEKYSGLFKSGGIGIMRLSLAANPDAIGSFAPGMALKFLIDGQPSRNLMVMNSLEGQGANKNWFAKAFSNEIPIPSSWTLRMVLWLFSWIHSPANILPLDHLAAIDTNGVMADPVVVPDQLIFEPSEDVRALISEDSMNDFRIDLLRIKKGTTLYHVMAKNKETKEMTHIANIVLNSGFYASRYADKLLFFRHHP